MADRSLRPFTFHGRGNELAQLRGFLDAPGAGFTHLRGRRRIGKSELLKKSGGNLNRWINGLIEQALDLPSRDWDAHFRRPRRRFRNTADEVRDAGR